MSTDYILVVDDNASIRNLLFSFLTQEGFKVTLASGGQEAIEKSINSRPKLVLLDLKMPGIKGLDVVDQLNLLYPELPVIIMTSFTELDLIKQGIKQGIIKYYIPKPFDLEKMTSLIRLAIKKAEFNNFDSA